MEASPVKRLYKYYGLLAEAAEQGDKILEHEDLFNRIINARHGNAEEKRLAAQFIPKFFHHFPHLVDSAVSAQLDLCEDSDLVVRKQAVKEVTSLVRAHPSCSKRVAYFVAQLLGAEDVGEGLLVRNTLVALFNVDPAATLSGIFALIDDCSPKMRERCTTFLCNRLSSLNKSVVSKMRPTLISGLERSLENSKSHEIGTLVPLIAHTAESESSLDKTIVCSLERQLELEKEHLTCNEEDLKRIYQFTKFCKTHFLKGVNSGGFVEFYSLHLLPLIKQLDGYSTGTGESTAFLQQFIEIIPLCTELNQPETCYKSIFHILLDLLPTPVEEQGDKKPVHFTFLECLLGGLLELIHRIPPTFDSYESSLEELRNGLKVLALYVESYRKCVAELDETTNSSIKSTALRCLDNLKVLIRQFFFNPPKSVSLVYSWSEDKVVAPKKRKTSSSSVERPKKDWSKSRGIQQIYTPPGGKYSRSFKRFS